MLSFVSLFAGIGGFDLGFERAGMDWPRIRTEAQEAFTLAGIPYLVKRELIKV